jgi:hypothetical protein
MSATPSAGHDRGTRRPHTGEVSEAQRLLRHYRLSALEAGIGYAVASAVVLLWPGAGDAPWPLVLGAYVVVLAVVLFSAVDLIEHRRPWPFGPRYELPRRTSGFFFVFLFIGLLLLRVADLLLQPLAFPQTLTVGLGIWLLWYTVSVSWRPLTLLMYPWLRPPPAETPPATEVR